MGLGNHEAPASQVSHATLSDCCCAQLRGVYCNIFAMALPLAAGESQVMYRQTRHVGYYQVRHQVSE